jgi:diguanylate cyclase (GGDEF)-like protein
MVRKVQPARVLGVLFMAGATLALVSILLPHPPLRLGLLGAAIITAYTAGALVFRYADQVSDLLMNAVLLSAPVLIGVAIYSAAVTGGVYGAMFFWVALFAGLFCTRRWVMAHVAWVMAVDAILLTLLDNPVGFSPITRWLLTAISIGVVAAVTNWIATDRNRIDAERQDLLAAADTLANTDALTGLPNRRAWDATVALALQEAAASGRPLCVALIDVDNLKLVNDRDGHAAGDEMLQEAADAWREVLRGRDYIARYGGDEFAVLLGDCDRDEAQNVVERLRQAAPLGHSYSAGAAAWDGEESVAELIARADGSLYRAKAAGRDRLALAPA